MAMGFPRSVELSDLVNTGVIGLIESKPDVAGGLLINRVISTEEADYIHEKFNALTERFLNRIPSYLGHLPEDEIVKESISSQKLIASLSADSTVAQSLTEISQFLLQKVFSSTEADQITSQRTINVNPAVADIRE
jgi:MinD-like ATPase involved in chromosome partitioning or flagellar assembly